MKPQYQTLDDYLDDLDAIKEKIADKTRGMNTERTPEIRNTRVASASKSRS